MTQEQERLIERLQEALSVIAYENPSEPWLVAHNALKATAAALHEEAATSNSRLSTECDALREALEAIKARHGWCVGRCNACEAGKSALATLHQSKESGK